MLLQGIVSIKPPQFDVPDKTDLCSWNEKAYTLRVILSLKYIKVEVRTHLFLNGLVLGVSNIKKISPSSRLISKYIEDILYEESDAADPTNYRPISILSVLSKVLERVAHTQLYSYFTEHNIFISLIMTP